MPIPVLGVFPVSLNALKPVLEVENVIPILKMKKLRLRKAKQLA